MSKVLLPSLLSSLAPFLNHVTLNHPVLKPGSVLSYLKALYTLSMPRPLGRLLPPKTEATVPKENCPSGNNLFPVGLCLDKCS